MSYGEARRILVTGSTGSGKTTVAGALARKTALPHVELDALHWGPNWTMREDFLKQAYEAIAQDAWIVEGGYQRITAAAYPRAELVVWLDLPFRVVFRQLFLRTTRRLRTQEPFFAGNRESYRMTFFSRESLLLWLARTYRSRRRHVLELAERYPEVKLVRLRSRRDVDGWIGRVR